MVVRRVATRMAPKDDSRRGSPFTDPLVREQVRELPPSATLVAKVLADEGPLTQTEIAEESLLAERTVRHALSMLATADLVESRHGFPDARTRVYDFSPPDDRTT